MSYFKFISITLLSLSIILSPVLAQKQVVVSEQTIKLNALQELKLSYGFAKGDVISYTMSVENNNTLSEVEISEFPNNIKFSNINIKKVNLKNLVASQNAVYQFRLKNNASTSRICKLKISRLPINESSQLYNTTVSWQTLQKTVFKTITKDVITSYDTSYIQSKKLELIKTELTEDIILDKTERINATNIIGKKNKKTIVVNLPNNELSTYKKKRIVSWVYWIGVGKEATEAWKKNVGIYKNLASGAATILGGGPMAGFAIGTLASFVMPSMGEDVAYWLIPDFKNSQLFINGLPFKQFDKGKGIAAYGKNNRQTQGSFYIGLLNDNKLQDIDTNVKISVVWEINYYADKMSTQKIITPKFEKRTINEPIIQIDTVPVNPN